MQKKILITGALGQIGTELTFKLRALYGGENVIATDIRMPQNDLMLNGGPFEFLDVLNPHQILKIVKDHNIKTIYHMAALLSAVGENRPKDAWEINMSGLTHILEAAKAYGCALFFPSSIAAFGPETPKQKTPQVTTQRPTTMYGITKVAGELLCDYYHHKFQVDTRGLRFPGLISYLTQPGGGTTDYAVEIFSHAKKHQRYECYLRADTYLDMMYIDDAVAAITALMQADPAKLKRRNAYNIASLNFCPSVLAQEIKKYIPDFQLNYKIDPVRQAIADSWPDSLDDTAAREDWGWAPQIDISRMVQIMLENI